MPEPKTITDYGVTWEQGTSELAKDQNKHWTERKERDWTGGGGKRWDEKTPEERKEQEEKGYGSWMPLSQGNRHQGDRGIEVLKDPEEVVGLDAQMQDPNHTVDLKVKVMWPYNKGGTKNCMDALLNNKPDKVVRLDKVRPMSTIGELKDRLEREEGMPKPEMRVFVGMHLMADTTKVCECYVNWMGYGMDRWPPHFVVKPQVQHGLVWITIPAMRETACWEEIAPPVEDEINGGLVKHYPHQDKLLFYGEHILEYDLPASTPVDTLMELCTEITRLPPERQRLFVQVDERDYKEQIEEKKNQVWDGGLMEIMPGKTLGDYNFESSVKHTGGLQVSFVKNSFNKDGYFVFDDGSVAGPDHPDAYIDHEGLKNATWIKPESEDPYLNMMKKMKEEMAKAEAEATQQQEQAA